MPSRSKPQVPWADELIKHASYLEQLSRALVVDEHVARDLVQETWSRALERPPRHGANPRAWLAQILRRTHWRWSRRAREEGMLEELVETWDPGAALERVDVNSTISAALQELDGPAREVLQLRFFDDLPPRAIAARLAVPVSTVNTRLQRALGQIRARLDRRLGRSAWLIALLGHPIGADRGSPVLSEPPSSFSAGWPDSKTEESVGTSVRLAAGFLLLGATWTVVFLARPDARAADGAVTPDGQRVAEARSALAETSLDRLVASAKTTSAQRVVEPAGPAESAPPAGAVPRLVVQVFDRNGRPVPRAEVSSFAHGTPPGSIVRLGTADDRGRFELDVEAHLLSPASDPLLGGRVGLMATGPAWTPSEMHYVFPDAGELTLVLGPPGRTIRGRVWDIERRAVANARVEVGQYASLIERDGVLLGTIPRVEHTGGDGEFTLEQVPAGAQLLTVSAPGLATARTYAPDDPNQWVEVVLEHAGRVAGLVHDADGEPLEGAELWVLVPAESWAPSPVRSDENGAFVLGGMSPGDYHVFARDPRRPEQAATRRVTVRGGEEIPWHPRLAPSRGLTVELVDEVGEPLVDWLVNFASEDRLWLVGAVTDIAGELTIVDLPEGHLSVSVLGERLELDRVVVPRMSLSGVTSADSPLRIVVADASAPSARITGELMDPGGLPPASVRIRIRRQVEAAEGDVPVDVRTGRFSTPLIPPGTWLLRGHVSQLGSFDLGAFALDEGEELDLGRVALPPAGTLALTWSALTGDRVFLSHLVQGRLHRTRVLNAPLDHPIPLLPGKVQIQLCRGDGTYEQSAGIAPGAELEVDLDSLFEN